MGLIQAIFLIVSTAIAVLLMNLFIGVLSSNYDRYEEMSNISFMRHRVIMLSEYARRPWSQVWRRWHGSIDYSISDEEARYFVVALREEQNQYDERSLRKYISQERQKSMKQMDGRLEKSDKQMDERWGRMDER